MKKGRRVSMMARTSGTWILRLRRSMPRMRAFAQVSTGRTVLKGQGMRASMSLKAPTSVR
ncbi:hypothetical protein D3C72_2114490 [compost metagenome]